MMETQSVLFWSATTLYAVATLFFFVGGVFRREWGTEAGRWAALAGLIPHVIAILLRWQEVGHGPYNTRYEVISANTFVLISCYFISTWRIPRFKGIGILLLPVAFLMMGWGVSTFGVRSEVPIIFKSYWLWLHIGFAKAFAATTLIAGASACAFLVKERRPERLSGLPEPARLDLASYQFLLISFLFLGVMIIAGSLWAHQSWGRYWAWDPIETSSLVTWMVFGIILHLRTLHGWTGRRFAWLGLVALGFGVATIYVVTLVVPTIHNSYFVGK